MVGLWANDGFINGPKRNKNHPVNVPINPRYRGVLSVDDETGLVYCSDMRINYGAAQPISDTNPTGSRVSSTGLVLSWDGHTLRSGKAKNFADATGTTDGTLSGGVTAGGATGIRGAATALDGVDDGIVFSGLTIPDQFTFRILANRKRVHSASEHIIAFGTGQIALVLNGSASTAKLYNSGGGMSGGTSSASWACPVGVHEFIVSIDKTNGKYKVWQDGIEVDSGSVTSSTPGTIFTIGTAVTNYPQADTIEAQLWGNLKTATEVRQLYEDTYGWVTNAANPHCKDISDTYPLGSDRVSATGCVLALDMETLTVDGKLKDFSGAGNHATITGAKYARGAIKNGAYAFSAATDSLATPITADYAQATYAFFVKPTNFTAAYDVLGKASGDNITIEQTTGKIQFTSNGVVKSTTGLTAGKVAFVIVKVNDNAVTIKVDNVANGSGNVTGRTASANAYKLGKFAGTAVVGTIGPTFVFSGLTTDAQDTNLFYDAQKMLGLVQGGTTNINVPGQVGQAVDLNGTSQYVEVQDCPALAFPQVTYGAWVNLDTFTGYPTIISKKGASGASFKLYGNQTAPNNLIAYYSDGVSQTSTGRAMAANKWALAAATYNGASLIAYLDGVASAPTNFVATASSNASPLRIGIEYNLGYPTDGRIAFPFIFNRALSASEIARLRLIGLSARW